MQKIRDMEKIVEWYKIHGPGKESGLNRNTGSKRIALVKGKYTPYGGAEKITGRLIDAFLDEGCSVDLLTLPGQKWENRCPSLTIIPLGHRHAGRIGRLISFQRAVGHHLHSHSYDIAFGIEYTAGLTHIRLGGGTHQACLDYTRGDQNFLSSLLHRFNTYDKLKKMYESRALQSPSLKRFYCNSNMVREEIIASYHISPQRIRVVHNGVEWKAFGSLLHRQDEMRQQLIRKHHLPSGLRFLVFIGSGFKRKGLKYAIQGMQYLPSPFHLLVIGKGNTGFYKRMARTLSVSERVHFLGPQKEASLYLTLADGFMLPTQYDPFSNASLEALAMGVPVLTSSRNGCSEIIHHDQTGVILPFPFQTKDLQEYFHKFAELVQKSSDHSLREEIRQSVRYLDFTQNLKKIVGDVLETDPSP